MKVPLIRPMMGKEEEENILSVLRSGMLAQGPWVKRFEEEFAKLIGVEHAVAVSSGTAALDLALKAMGVGAGDEVIVPDFTFIATANAVLFQRAKPVFADIEPSTFNISPKDVESKITPKTKAVIAVHLFGQPAELSELERICAEHGIKLLEDCAQAHGAEYNGRRVGSFGTGAFSFYPTKNMTSGEGGMVTTGDGALAKQIDLLRNHGQSDKYLHTSLGYNLRMNDIEASIGVAQLGRLEEMNRKRIENAEFLNGELKDVGGIAVPEKKENTKHVYHQYVIKVTPEFPLSRDELKKFLAEKEIGSAIHYPKPIHEQPFYSSQGYAVECPVAVEAAKQVLSLPVYPSLEKEQLVYVAESVKEAGE